MPLTSRKTKLSRLLMHVSMVIFAVVLGHDALMAMNPHGQETTPVHHGVAVEQCGADEGRVQSPSGFLGGAVPSNGVLGNGSLWANSEAATLPPSAPTLSPAMLRALLQVYLN